MTKPAFEVVDGATWRAEVERRRLRRPRRVKRRNEGTASGSITRGAAGRLHLVAVRKDPAGAARFSGAWMLALGISFNSPFGQPPSHLLTCSPNL
jgi:hypothetical protein